MALQEYSNRFPPDLRDQFAFERFLNDQSHRPPSGPCRRSTAHHRDDALLIGRTEDLLGARTGGLEDRRVHASVPVPPRDAAHRFRRQVEPFRDLGRTPPAIELKESQRSDNDPYLLHPTLQQAFDAPAIPRA